MSTCTRWERCTVMCNDFLANRHTIVQTLESTSGSLWTKSFIMRLSQQCVLAVIRSSRRRWVTSNLTWRTISTFISSLSLTTRPRLVHMIGMIELAASTKADMVMTDWNTPSNVASSEHESVFFRIKYHHPRSYCRSCFIAMILTGRNVEFVAI